ncbi:hypothetical protein E2562_032734 [Oryza meyeriana var. granulata]|uniref:rRNA N-glycosylase n=1 Tax=Oryza meyeriana var. granulata TaxID=110450 RepID=A0A6G1ES27_9ORYZ|nr:hypothetical protein E2562_032734 [Oryza meyeriana var. granulata]
MAALSFFFLLLLPLAGNLPAVVLGKLQSEESPSGKLTMVELQDYGSGVGTLAVLRADDIYVAGFANRSLRWHALRGNEHLLHGRAVTPLPFGNSYDDLVGGVNNLLGLPLGEPARDQATVVLSGHDSATAIVADEEALKRALATLTVATCEAQQLRPILETMLTGPGARVAADHLPYIEHWDGMWHELKRWRRSGEWGGPFTGELRERAKIAGAEEALAVLGWTFRQRLLGDGSVP